MAVPTPVVAQPGAVVGARRGPGLAVRRLVRRRLVRGRRRASSCPCSATASAPSSAATSWRWTRSRSPARATRTVLRYYDHVFPVRPGTESLPLAELVDRQHYRLAYWRVADEELNYRRFFDVGTLARDPRRGPRGVRRHPRARPRRCSTDGTIDGLRIDHPDGLADPRRLPRRGCARRPAAPGWSSRRSSRATRSSRADWETAGHAPATRRCGASRRPSSTPGGAAVLGAVMHRLTGRHVRRLPGAWSSRPSARSSTARSTPRCTG